MSARSQASMASFSGRRACSGVNERMTPCRSAGPALHRTGSIYLLPLRLGFGLSVSVTVVAGRRFASSAGTYWPVRVSRTRLTGFGLAITSPPCFPQGTRGFRHPRQPIEARVSSFWPVDDAELRASLARMDSKGRGALRKTLIADQPYRDAMAERLLRERADGVADLLDFLTLNPEQRKRVARVLGEIEARG